MENKNFTRIKEVEKLLNSKEVELDHPLKSKTIKRYRSILEKKMSSALKNIRRSGFETWGMDFLSREEIKKNLLCLSKVQDLPSAILRLSFLNSFESCHILVHEKGKPIGQNYFSFRGVDEQTKLIPVQNFNTLFNLVKKSKNKIFHQSPSLKDDLSIVGNFLAKEIELKNHSVIYLISRNSFLSASEEEQGQFQSISLFLYPLLIRLLEKEKNELKEEVLKQALKHFPERICIKKHHQIIFTNEVNESSYENSNLMIFPLENEDQMSMELSNLSKDKISAELYHSQRISLLGELLNTLQHELSNPLFGLNLTSELLAGEVENEEMKTLLHEISHNAHRSQTIIKNFSSLYNEQQEFKTIELCSFLEGVMTLTKSETKEIAKSIQCVGFTREEGLEIKTNPTYLTQIIFNLVINAAQAIKEQGRGYLENSIIIKLIKAKSSVEILIIDNGPGIKEEHFATLFKPFFTTKGSGTGLGLSICQNLARCLDSKITFKNNSPLLGATFSINLPL